MPDDTLDACIAKLEERVTWLLYLGVGNVFFSMAVCGLCVYVYTRTT